MTTDQGPINLTIREPMVSEQQIYELPIMQMADHTDDMEGTLVPQVKFDF